MDAEELNVLATLAGSGQVVSQLLALAKENIVNTTNKQKKIDFFITLKFCGYRGASPYTRWCLARPFARVIRKIYCGLSVYKLGRSGADTCMDGAKILILD